MRQVPRNPLIERRARRHAIGFMPRSVDSAHGWFSLGIISYYPSERESNGKTLNAAASSIFQSYNWESRAKL
jgi:hypothetical protein